MKKITKIFPGAIFIFLIIIGAFFAWKYYEYRNSFAKPVGKLTISSDEKLQSKINAFMESQKGDFDLGKENYHCSNKLYGYDDKYAYAWVYCSGFMFENGKLERGTAFSIPTRLEYIQPSFQIMGFKQTADGSQNAVTYRQLFPEGFYKENGYLGKDTDNLVHDVEIKAETQLHN